MSGVAVNLCNDASHCPDCNRWDAERQSTHWDGCWQEHGACAQERVRKLEKERIELEARILRLEKKLALSQAQLRERRWDE